MYECHPICTPAPRNLSSSDVYRGTVKSSAARSGSPVSRGSSSTCMARERDGMSCLVGQPGTESRARPALPDVVRSGTEKKIPTLSSA